MTGVVVQFTDTLNADLARKLGAYKVLLAGRDKKFGTKDDTSLALSQALYDASKRTVTLIPKKAFKMTVPKQLRIIAAQLKDLLGRNLDGNHDGNSGGDFAAIFKKVSVKLG